ncbi:glycerophosphoryl diester phosphodiesterase [Dinoroseobacter shibae DFL 12 = DSM 16493]|uniref:glycerophosphodiester phosphodiesterase n=1 Tax=Dinoroseobacter shibae (strain DSM 16493 / NCIMB 14021 / DFL 12) TaxID=398580 RepID=A8LQ42_DINSH|nr:glycerophosphodiester phosphodiesterase family protein [Dinoroseobacter shibae]ABV95282.1 glycerophosphoryl diester phosphodiesterase [Dinoroseobacter shibae DFL 12 = DSM 16493]URF46688.1 glycerophosphodiester phosphodiesterase [Dinoroseobacter shibae]URF50994.1 glycerophosphodiester phosphodiesterase [Dinoroseobacter shibae]
MRHILTLLATGLAAAPALAQTADVIELGPRPFYLVDRMEDGPLKEKLMSCMGQEPKRTLFSIGHRGAPLQFPEHTVASNLAAARMGAGILECDVTFTKDLELVCRHAQNDLHTTTNILATPLAETCVTPFTPASGDQNATAECRTSEITLAEYRTLVPKMDAANRAATSVEAYLDGTAGWRTDLYAGEPTGIMTHAESIELFKSLGAKFTPELKSPSVEMPFNGFTQEDYAQKLVDEYKAAGIPASDVWLQSFNLDDVLYWISAEPEFGAQAVYLMDEYNIDGYSPMDPATWPNTMAELKAMGVNYIAPPTWMLVTTRDGAIVPSELAVQAQAAGLNIITWTVERSGPLATGGGWYYQSIADVTDSDGVVYELIDVLAQDVGVEGIFSDWPATTTFYASCMGLD